MRHITLTYAFLMAFCPTVAHAQGQVTTLARGVPAPFSGTLMDADAVARIIADKEFAEKRCELDKALASAIQKAKLDLDLGNMKIERDILQEKYKTITALKDVELTKAYSAVESANKSASYKWLYFVGGVIAGAALTVGVTYSVVHAR